MSVFFAHGIVGRAEFAHAGHWIANLLYLAPVIVLLVAVGVAKVRERRGGGGGKG